MITRKPAKPEVRVEKCNYSPFCFEIVKISLFGPFLGLDVICCAVFGLRQGHMKATEKQSRLAKVSEAGPCADRLSQNCWVTTVSFCRLFS